ncbi:MAG: T9SS type A sorting domain-containing protein, partial [Saprospiraceae bacterium]|nr:T9SS type A sorting domain-containing protein [Saprospiraceae bacterium]
PNPTANLLYIDCEESIRQVKIFSIDGRLLSSYEVLGTAIKKQLDVSSLSAGSYLLWVKTDKGTASKYFVKE